jgi:Cft2 family RNA processing exonuclease
LAEYVGKINVVLISHAKMELLGGLPWLITRPGFKALVYSTYPVMRLGSAIMFDGYLSRSNYEHLSTINLDDINAACERIKPLKYSQKERVFEIDITPFRSGHTLGGTAWKITHDLQDFVYCPSFNPHAECHLDGLDFESI